MGAMSDSRRQRQEALETNIRDASDRVNAALLAIEAEDPGTDFFHDTSRELKLARTGLMRAQIDLKEFLES